MNREGKSAKVILFIYMTIELFISAMPMFGWPSLVYILREQKYYDYVCERSKQIDHAMDVNINSTTMQKMAETSRQTTPLPSSTANSEIWTPLGLSTLTTRRNVSTKKAITTETSSVNTTITTRKSDIKEDITHHSNVLNCPERETKLNGIFVASVVSSSVSLVPASFFTEKFGPHACRVVSSLLFASSGVIWIFATNHLPFLVYLASILLSIAGSMSYLPLLQISTVIYDKYLATVISIENGAIDASAFVLVLFKLIYDSGSQLSFLWILSIYCGFVASMILVTTFTLLPTRQEYSSLQYSKSCRDLIKSGSKIEVGDYYENDQTKIILNDLILPKEAKNEVVEGFNYTWEITTEDSKTLDRLGENIVRKAKNYREEGYNVKLKQNGATVDNSRHLIQDTAKSDQAKQSDLRKSLFSGLYFWELLLVSFSMTRMYFYISAFDNLVSNLSKDPEILSKYTNTFGVIQFTGIVFAPMLGPYIDGKLSPCSRRQKVKQETENLHIQKLQRYSVAIAITNSLGVIMEALVLIPNLEIQVMSMVFQVALRGFLYAIHFSYIAAAFPARHYGKLASIAMLIGSIAGCIQYPLNSLMEGPLNGDPFFIHLALLFISCTVYGQSIHLSLKLRKAKIKGQSRFESKLAQQETMLT